MQDRIASQAARIDEITTQCDAYTAEVKKVPLLCQIINIYWDWFQITEVFEEHKTALHQTKETLRYIIRYITNC